MKRSGLLKGIIFIALIGAVLLISVACSSQTKESELVTIQEQVPLAGQTSVATAKETFDNGGSVNTTSLENGSVIINTNLAGKGVIGVQANVLGDFKLKVKVSLDETSVYYDIKPGQMIKIPMQMGNGTYTVELYRNISGSQYAKLFGDNIDIAMDNANDVYLLSNQIVNFEDSGSIPELEKTLVQNKNNDSDKLKAIYEYVIQTISYDYEKIKKVDSTYIPDVDKVLQTQQGICYDYAAVMASLLREAGIPAKLVMGNRADTPIYHAWNEVLINGKWIIIDATWDSTSLKSGKSYEMEKDAGLYTGEKVF